MSSNPLQSNSLWAASGAFGNLGGPGTGAHGAASSSSGSASIDSLTLTAQSVGLTLEQLALALSKSSNLKTLAQDYNSSGGSISTQHELALSLFHNETLALYRRCMLLAGFDPSATEETSPEYLQFAFKAWQEEGKRLQERMGPDGNFELTNSISVNQQAAGRVNHATNNIMSDSMSMQLHLQQQHQQLLFQNPSFRSLYNPTSTYTTPSAAAAAAGADDFAKLQLYGLNSMYNHSL